MPPVGVCGRHGPAHTALKWVFAVYQMKLIGGGGGLRSCRTHKPEERDPQPLLHFYGAGRASQEQRVSRLGVWGPETCVQGRDSGVASAAWSQMHTLVWCLFDLPWSWDQTTAVEGLLTNSNWFKKQRGLWVCSYVNQGWLQVLLDLNVRKVA